MNFIGQTEEKVNNSLWVEQYRPTVLDTYIGNDHLKDRLSSYIEDNDIPHLLFHGKPGTGKTTAAKLIVNSIKCDYMYINASDENGVDIIRDKIKGFASTMGFNPLKIIILDESDFLTANGQAALRNVMETFSQHCRFILTCNYVEKIVPAIQSRCQIFQITPPSKKDIAIHVSKILTEKGIQFDVKDLVPIIDSSYPDIRKIINTCQLNSHKGVLKLDVTQLMENDYKQKVLDILKSNVDKKTKYNTIRKALADSKVTDFTELYTFLYEKVDDFSPKSTSVSILTLSEGQYKSSLVIDKEIPMIATIINLLNTLD
jgi:DNA polymerase III delta prime subunit